MNYCCIWIFYKCMQSAYVYVYSNSDSFFVKEIDDTKLLIW